MNRIRILSMGLLVLFCFYQNVIASTYPGGCTVIVYTQGTVYPEGTMSSYSSVSINVTDNAAQNSQVTNLPSNYTGSASVFQFGIFYFNGTVWEGANIFPIIQLKTASAIPGTKVSSLTVSAVTSSVGSSCPNLCTEKAGQVNYKLQNYPDGTSFAPSASCYDGCQQNPIVLWSDCLNDNCIASVKYTYTGNSCTNEPGIDDLQPNPPPDCQDEIKQKIAQCGGSLNVLSFDYNTCTGECTPDSCQDQWAALLSRCGGIMGVASWDASTCSGTCASDPVPQPSDPDDKPPEKIEEKVQTNPDGSKSVTTTTTYYNSEDHYTYKNETTTHYDSSGNQTGQSSTTTKTSGEDESGEDEPEETFSPISPSGFGESYNPGEYDIPGRFTTFLDRVKSTGLFSFSSSFFNSLPGGGSPVYEINGGETFGTHSIDLSQTMAAGLTVLKTILLACFGFLSIRAVIMKR